ncbi:hypothetical protein V6N12_065325 [Hibiscus sabdariffa]|uniref:Uncharacterized protein n=1 Tax=Hibiscus sabdariffa TaxID=183260 RepID=A0ABR2G8D5_9ROSI
MKPKSLQDNPFYYAFHGGKVHNIARCVRLKDAVEYVISQLSSDKILVGTPEPKQIDHIVNILGKMKLNLESIDILETKISKERDLLNKLKALFSSRETGKNNPNSHYTPQIRETLVDKSFKSQL